MKMDNSDVMLLFGLVYFVIVVTWVVLLILADKVERLERQNARLQSEMDYLEDQADGGGNGTD